MDREEFEARFPVRLNHQQLEAVRAVQGPVLLLAVPGSGKTTVLVARLGYMIYVCGIQPEKILTVTYTVAATRDMRRRFASFFGQEMADRLEFRTINGICARIIGQFSRMIGKRPFQLVTDEKKTAAVLSGIYEDVEGEWPTEGDLRDVRTLITYIKNSMLSEEEIRQEFQTGAGRRRSGTFPGSGSERAGRQRSGPFPGSGADRTGRYGDRREDSRPQTDINIAEIYQRYNRWLRQNSLMDYDDQMVYALAMLRRSPDLLTLLQDTYPYICVDEAQDTSKIQHTILSLLASRDGNLFMVGDEDQSIYGFRAAYPEALTGFEKDHPGARVLLMEENYRSGPEIISMADRFIRRNTLRHAKSMRAGSRGEPGKNGAQERGVPQQGPAQVREIGLKGRRAQYTYLAKVGASLAETGSGTRDDLLQNPSRKNPGPVTAVLYRNNESAVGLVDRLDREGVPFRIRNAEIAFFTHRTVGDIRAVLRLCLDPSDTDSFMRIYYRFNLYLKKDQARRICDRSRALGIGVLDAAIGDVPAIRRRGDRDGASPGKMAEKTSGSAAGLNLPSGALPTLHANAVRGLKNFRTQLRQMKKDRGDEAVERIVRDMGYGDNLDGRGLSDSRIFTLRSIGAGTDSPAALLDRLDQLYEILANREMDPACPFVLSTIHASKGLEYDTVYLMDVTDGTFPETVPDDTGRMTAQERAAFEEERRVFYVGVTRARNRLNIFTLPGMSVFADEFFGREKDTGSGGTKGKGGSYTGNGISDLLHGMLEEDRDGGAPGRGSRAGQGRRGRAVIKPQNPYADLSGRKKVAPGKLQAYIRSLGPGLAVTHASYGEGAVVSLDGKKIRIRFEDRERVFSIETLCAQDLLKF